MPKTAKKLRYAHARGASYRRVGDETVVLNIDTSDYFALNETGTLIWSLLGEGRDPSRIAEKLRAAYRVDEKRAKADVESLIAELLKRDLLVAVK